jgi:cell division protein FtsQ
MADRKVIARIFQWTGWTLAGTAVVVLLAGAIGIRNRNTCRGVRIGYAHPGGGRYVDATLIWSLLATDGGRTLVGRPLRELDLNRMEERLEKDPWIRDADLYLDRAHELHIRIEEKAPVARVFTRTGHSFYIDSQLNRIPLNTRYTDRLPVFTGMPVSIMGRQPGDTQHLAEAWQLVRYLRTDELAMAIVDQANYEAASGFVLIPKLGEHRIVFGDMTDIAGKFRRLRIFYQQVMSRTGWNSYRQIDLRFKGQVVAIPTFSMPSPIDTAVSNPPPTTSHGHAPDAGKPAPKPHDAHSQPKAVMPAPRT